MDPKDFCSIRSIQAHPVFKFQALENPVRRACNASGQGSFIVSPVGFDATYPLNNPISYDISRRSLLGSLKSLHLSANYFNVDQQCGEFDLHAVVDLSLVFCVHKMG